MPHLTEISATAVAATVHRLRATFATGRTKPMAWRRAQLRALRGLLTESKQGSYARSAAGTGLSKNRAVATSVRTSPAGIA